MKNAAFLLIVSLMVLVKPAPLNAQNDELILWSRYDLADSNNKNAVALAARIETFEQTTGINVNYEQVAWDQLAPKLAIAATSGGEVPDVVETRSHHIPALLDAGILMPLDDLLADHTWVAELTSGDTNACIIDGVRYCVAHNVRGGITYFRADLFPEGFPATAEAWLTVAPGLSSDGQFFSTQYAGRSSAAIEIMWWPMIASNGGAIFDIEGKPAWASDEVVEVVEFGRTLFQEGYFPQINITGDFPDAEAPWINGDAASFRGASWSAIFMPALQEAVNSGQVLMTGGVDFGGGAFVLLVSEGFVVPQNAQNPQAAARWLDLFFQPENLAEWADAQSGIPTLPAAYNLIDFDTPFYQSVDRILSQQGLYMERSPYYIESLDVLAVAFQEMLLNPELDAMQRLEDAASEVLNRYW